MNENLQDFAPSMNILIFSESESDSDADYQPSYIGRPSPDTEEEDSTHGGQRNTEVDNCVTFDGTLPMQHSYLGSDLTLLQGRTLLDEGSVHLLPLLPQQDVVLVPGQTLPLTVLNPGIVSMVRHVMESNRIFGAICLRYNYNNMVPQVAKFAEVGTTAEIYECQDPEEHQRIRIKAIGRQRFRILEVKKVREGYSSARVEILPEIILPDPLAEFRLQGYDRYRSPGLNEELNKSKKTHFRVRDAVTSVWPSWVYGQYEVELLVQRMTQQLATLNLAFKVPTDPVDLSFWVARSLPIRDKTRLKLLSLNSAIQRLRWELGILNKLSILCCRTCNMHVAHQQDIFSMSAEGLQGAYCNEYGYVYETITLHKAQGLRLLSDTPSTEYSWFPGYGWTIAECTHCGKHMGWMFTATKPELKPKRFWGLCRRSLTAKLQSKEE